jgi:hypothetical protein
MAPTTQELPRQAWRPYFDELSKTVGTVKATVEVDGQDLGTQVAAHDMVLTGLTYDDRDDIMVIGLDAPGGQKEEFEHMVDHPQRIFVATGEGADMAIDIEDGEHHQTIIRIERPQELPPA